MTDHQNSSAGSDDGPDTPDEALDLLMHEAGWIDMHGGDHHEDDCPVCRSIAMVRAGLNHAYPPSHAGGTFTDAQAVGMREALEAVQSEIVLTGHLAEIVDAALAAQPPAAPVEPSAWHCPACEAAVIVDDPTPAHLLCSAASDDLIERLRNPMWAHSTAPFPSPQLEQEENLAAMNEAAAEIERLRAVPQEAWQPMDTAPKDKCILVATAHKLRPHRIAWWSERQLAQHGNGWAFDGNGFITPLAWQPLPDTSPVTRPEGKP